ncbi:MAG: MFS transporter, partial [Actinomycetota bacterium]|nr:MFS transporter [Actinomycetota bacterium]
IVTGGATIWLGFTGGVPEFLAAALVAGMGTGLITPAQGATVADVIGSRAKGGPVLAAFQMTADIGAILGPVAAGLIADQLSYAAAFALTGAISLLAAVAWLRSPETLPRLQDNTATDIAVECGCRDEGPEVPTGQRMAGRSHRPHA